MYLFNIYLMYFINILFIYLPFPQGISGQVEYRISQLDSQPQTIGKWFYLNPTTGVVSVSTLLTADPTKRDKYIVSIRPSFTLLQTRTVAFCRQEQ